MSKSVIQSKTSDCQVDQDTSLPKQINNSQVRLLRLLARCALQLLREREAPINNGGICQDLPDYEFTFQNKRRNS